MFKCLNVKMNKGFTILELLIAILVITIGVLGSYSVTQQILVTTISSTHRLTAAYLGKEGIEIVRNIRDTNWINGDSFSAGLVANGGFDGCNAGYFCEADYNDASLASVADSTAARELMLDNFYSYDSGLNSIYKRKITITPEGADKLKVSVEVEWRERSNTHTVTIQENLYDWK